MNRIKKMKFDEAFAKYRRYLIASSIANTYEEAIKEWEVIKVENRPNKDLISFKKLYGLHESQSSYQNFARPLQPNWTD